MLISSAIVIFILAMYRFFNMIKKIRHYHKVNAVVVEKEIELNQELFSEKEKFDYPILEYVDREGRKRQVVSKNTKLKRPAYKRGEKIALLIHPTDPTLFMEYDIINVYLIPAAWIVLAGFLFWTYLKYS
ncbi:hypothetical protein ACI6Q2_00420 [Chitinophagaceae bacterium LWZ2-11]